MSTPFNIRPLNLEKCITPPRKGSSVIGRPGAITSSPRNSPRASDSCPDSPSLSTIKRRSPRPCEKCGAVKYTDAIRVNGLVTFYCEECAKQYIDSPRKLVTPRRNSTV